MNVGPRDSTADASGISSGSIIGSGVISGPVRYALDVRVKAMEAKVGGVESSVKALSDDIVVTMPIEDASKDSIGAPSLRLALSIHSSAASTANLLPTPSFLSSSTSASHTANTPPQSSYLSLHIHESRNLSSPCSTPNHHHEPWPFVVATVLPSGSSTISSSPGGAKLFDGDSVGHGDHQVASGGSWSTKVGRGASPQWGEGFVIPVATPPSSRILLLSVWDARPAPPWSFRQAFLGMCTVELRDLDGKGGERFYTLLPLPPGVDALVPVPRGLGTNGPRHRGRAKNATASSTNLSTSLSVPPERRGNVNITAAFGATGKLKRRNRRTSAPASGSVGDDGDGSGDDSSGPHSPVSPVYLANGDLGVGPGSVGGAVDKVKQYPGQLVKMLRKFDHRCKPALLPVAVGAPATATSPSSIPAASSTRRAPPLRLPSRHDPLPLGSSGWLSRCAACGARVLAGGMKCAGCSGTYHTACVAGNECGGVGWVRLAVGVRRIPLLAAPAHATLLDLLTRSDRRLCHLLGTSGISDPLAAALVRAVSSLPPPASLSPSDAAPQVPPGARLVHALLVKEMQQGTTSAATLFRANTVGTKCMDAYLKAMCAGYCSKSVGQVVWSVVREVIEGGGWELDPAHISSPGLTSSHAAKLGALTDRLLDGVSAAREQLPGEVRWVFRELRRGAGRRFEEGGGEGKDAPSDSKGQAQGLLVPAILGPRLFGLVPPDVRISPGAKRTLTLLAKIFQTIANLSDFSGKEAYMEVMNSFIHDRMPKMRALLDHAATITDNELASLNSSRSRSHRPEKDLAVLAARLDEVQDKLQTAAESDDDRKLLTDLRAYLADPTGVCSLPVPASNTPTARPGSRSSSPMSDYASRKAASYASPPTSNISSLKGNEISMKSPTDRVKGSGKPER
ncbi:RAS protein activator like-3 [Gonapodya sp. JEL0774]|nr:RAS protein activator like-3 [Gonapodya sp. JEL0774]